MSAFAHPTELHRESTATAANEAAGEPTYAFDRNSKHRLFEQSTPVLRAIISFFIFKFQPLYVRELSCRDSLMAPSRSNS
jgi:hypothetical protein